MRDARPSCFFDDFAMPHSVYEEEDDVTEFEGVRVIMWEEKAICAKDFFNGSDFNMTSNSNIRVGARTWRVSTVFTGLVYSGLSAVVGGEDEIAFHEKIWY